MPNPKDINDPTTAMNMALALMSKAFKLNYSKPTNNKQRISSNPRNRQIAQPRMNMGQDRHMQMVGGNQFRQYAGKNVGNPNGYNDVQNNGLIGVPVNANRNLNRNGHLVAARAEGNKAGHNGSQSRGVGHFSRNCTQALTSGTQTDKAPVYDSDGSTESREELYFSNTSKTTNVSKSISIPNEEFLDDTSPSVARKFLNEVKSTIVTLQRVVKHIMSLETHNWSSSAHQELYKIVKDEIFSIVNQVDAKVQNFETQFLKEAAKFVGDFKSLAKKANESLAKHKALELENERLLRAVIYQDIMCVLQKASVIDTSDLQTELERTKARFENYIIKKENEYAKLWNDCYKKCDECKYDKISYDKAYKNMQQKIKRLKAQLGDLKGKRNPPKLGETHALSKPVTSNSIPTPQESKVVNNDKVIALGMFRINPFKTSREENHVPNTIRASVRKKPITVSQPLVFTKKDVNSDSNGLSSIGIDNSKTRRPHPRSNTKNDRVPSVSMSSCNKNKGVELEEHHMNLLLSKNNKHMSSACNNIKLDS
nr:hypothetical protein [Tanacetum cinerariifolium]